MTPSREEVLAILILRLGGEVEITDEELAAIQHAEVETYLDADFLRNSVRLRVRIPGVVIAGEIVEETRPAIHAPAPPA